MPTASQLRKGAAIEIQGQPHLVDAVQVQTPSARGASTLYKIRARNAITGQKVDLSCRGEEAFQEVEFEKRAVQFLYQDQDMFCFMDLESYEQFELHRDRLGRAPYYLTEDLELTALVIGGTVRGVELPDTVTLEIVECEPAVKGASATARTKPAVLVTGVTVQVPEHIAAGEKIKVDTRDDRYLGRA